MGCPEGPGLGLSPACGAAAQNVAAVPRRKVACGVMAGAGVFPSGTAPAASAGEGTECGDTEHLKFAGRVVGKCPSEKGPSHVGP